MPDEHFTKYYRVLHADIINGTSQVIFQGLAPGRYAVNILHDENGNGKIDRGLILPKEGIGFSNIESINIRNRPTFKKASFEFTRDKSVDVKVIYF